MAAKLTTKFIGAAKNWEDKAKEVADFVNQSLENKGQLVNIEATIAPHPKNNGVHGNIIIYYYENVNGINRKMKNKAILNHKTIRHNHKSQHQSSSEILSFVNEMDSKGLLYGVNHALQSSESPITIVWYWNIKPIYQNVSINDDIKQEGNNNSNEKNFEHPLNWSVSQVGEWLTTLGTSYKQYVKPFEDDGIDGEMMNVLTDVMLQYIINNPIHRTKILISWKKLNK